MNQQIIVDLSAGGCRKDGKIHSFFSSNISHMYEIRKDLLAKAPNFAGSPFQLYGASCIEGTVAEIVAFFDAFATAYDDETTKREVESILAAIANGETLIRCYRHVWPGRFPQELEESQMLARAVGVLSDGDRLSWGHAVSERTSFRLRCLWEVVAFNIKNDRIEVTQLNGFVHQLGFEALGFAWDGDKVPKGNDLERLWQRVEVVAGHYQEMLECHDIRVEQDPRQLVRYMA